MIKLIAQKRGQDAWGDGAFGASRDGGKRTHRGVDYLAMPGATVLSITAGKVTKIGWPYRGNSFYRYVQVTDGMGNNWRYFYVEPKVGLKVGDVLSAEVAIGTVQDLSHRYKGIPNHVHLEVKDHSGNYLNPELIKRA